MEKVYSSKIQAIESLMLLMKRDREQLDDLRESIKKIKQLNAKDL